MKKLLLLLPLALVLSCQSQATKQAKKKKEAYEYFALNKEDLANLCNLEFPSFPTYIKGDEVIKIDTIYSDGEIIECPEATELNPKPSVKCPPNKTIKSIIERTDTITKIDTKTIYLRDVEIIELKDKLKVCDDKNSELSDNYNKEKDTRIQFQWMFGVLALLVAVYTLFKIKRVF